MARKQGKIGQILQNIWVFHFHSPLYFFPVFRKAYSFPPLGGGGALLAKIFTIDHSKTSTHIMKKVPKIQETRKSRYLIYNPEQSLKSPRKKEAEIPEFSSNSKYLKWVKRLQNTGRKTACKVPVPSTMISIFYGQ